MSLEYLVGVDLGQAHDYTAVTILERITLPTEDGDWGRAEPEVLYKARHLERFDLGTPYPAQVDRIRRLVTATRQLFNPVTGEPAYTRLVVDQTGVGRPVVDMLSAAGLDLTAVTIHGGDQTIKDGRSYRVPKRELVSVLQRSEERR